MLLSGFTVECASLDDTVAGSQSESGGSPCGVSGLVKALSDGRELDCQVVGASSRAIAIVTLVRLQLSDAVQVSVDDTILLGEVAAISNRGSDYLYRIEVEHILSTDQCTSNRWIS